MFCAEVSVNTDHFNIMNSFEHPNNYDYTHSSDYVIASLLIKLSIVRNLTAKTKEVNRCQKPLLIVSIFSQAKGRYRSVAICIASSVMYRSPGEGRFSRRMVMDHLPLIVLPNTRFVPLTNLGSFCLLSDV